MSTALVALPTSDPETGYVDPREARACSGWKLVIGPLTFSEDHCEVTRSGKFIIFKSVGNPEAQIRLREGDWTRPDEHGVVRLAHLTEDEAARLARRLSQE